MTGIVILAALLALASGLIIGYRAGYTACEIDNDINGE